MATSPLARSNLPKGSACPGSERPRSSHPSAALLDQHRLVLRLPAVIGGSPPATVRRTFRQPSSVPSSLHVREEDRLAEPTTTPSSPCSGDCRSTSVQQTSPVGGSSGTTAHRLSATVNTSAPGKSPTLSILFLTNLFIFLMQVTRLVTAELCRLRRKRRSGEEDDVAATTSCQVIFHVIISADVAPSTSALMPPVLVHVSTRQLRFCHGFRDGIRHTAVTTVSAMSANGVILLSRFLSRPVTEIVHSVIFHVSSPSSRFRHSHRRHSANSVKRTVIPRTQESPSS